MLGLALPLVLAGCTTWVKPGATLEERDIVIAKCRAYAYQRVTPNIATVMTSPGGYRPGEQRCTTRDGNTVCRWIEGYYVPPSYSTQDMNDAARDAAIDDCMYTNGWHKE